MVAQKQTTTKTTRPRAIGATKLAEIMAAGGSIRRGTAIRGRFPVWQWQAFNEKGEFVAPIIWTAVRGFQISNERGVNL